MKVRSVHAIPLVGIRLLQMRLVVGIQTVKPVICMGRFRSNEISNKRSADRELTGFDGMNAFHLSRDVRPLYCNGSTINGKAEKEKLN